MALKLHICPFAFFVPMRPLTILLSTLLSTAAFGQYSVSGRVKDRFSGEPLAFAHVLINDGPHGTTTDLNGFFQIAWPGPIEQLTVKYIGYQTSVVKPERNGDSLEILLQPISTQLQEVTVHPGENPADRIIRNVVENRKRNDPSNLPYFRYRAYEKTVFTLEEDTGITNRRTAEDTTVATIRALLDKQHVMMSENVYERKFRNGRYTDHVEATRFSGMKDPQFAFLFGQMQSFSFYKDHFTLGDQAFLSPISPNSWKRYTFQIEDTLTVDRDTVIIISYRPNKGRSFPSLRGMLHVHLGDHALMNATAEAIDAQGVQVKVQHHYEKLNGHTWFPTQMNTDLTILGLQLSGFHIKGVNTIFLKEIDLNEKVRAIDIGSSTLEVESTAHRKDSAYWSTERQQPLSLKELRTYHVIDSLGREMKMDRRIRVLIAAATGRFPIGPVELDLDKIIDYNAYEGFRLGMGIHTAPDLLKWADVGTYVAYGFRDKEVKYGAEMEFSLLKSPKLILLGAYAHDVFEMGAQTFLLDDRPSLTEMYRDLVIPRMDVVTGWTAGARIDPLRGWSFQAQFSHQQVQSRHGYGFVIQHPASTNDTLSAYNFAEVRAGLRFAPFEQKWRLGKREIVQDPGAVVLWATMTRGISTGLRAALKADYDYWKLDLKLQGKFRIRHIGMEYWQLAAGWVSASLPYFKSYTPRFNYEPVSLFSPNSFETMRPNEFLNRYQFTLHHRHNFGQVRTGIRWIRPTFHWANSFGIGWLDKPELHTGLRIKDMSKGYFETGLVIDDLIKLDLIGLGGGVFYRYGPYAFSDQIDNLAFKLSMHISL